MSPSRGPDPGGLVLSSTFSSRKSPPPIFTWIQSSEVDKIVENDTCAPCKLITLPCTSLKLNSIISSLAGRSASGARPADRPPPSRRGRAGGARRRRPSSKTHPPAPPRRRAAPPGRPPVCRLGVREMGSAPRNPAPRNHFWRGLSNHQTATARMHSVETNIAECRPIAGALPLSLTMAKTTSTLTLGLRRMWRGKMLLLPSTEEQARMK